MTTRWGFYGAGRMAADFAQGLKHVAGAQVAYVASHTASRAEAFARAYGGQAGSAEALLGSDADVIYVCTPNHLHAQHAIAALQAGKAVLVEKPFALDEQQAKDIVAAADKAKKFCMEAMWSRLLPAARAATDAARAGELGDVRLVEASLGFPIAVQPGHRVFDPKQGGGALLDLGVYAVHAVHAVLGAPEKVTAEWVVGQTGVDETTLATLHYPHGVYARVACSIRHGCRDDLAIFGSNGTLVLQAPLYRPESLVVTPLQAQASDAGAAVSAPSALQALKARGEVRAAMGLLRQLRRSRRLPALGNGYAHEAIEVHERLKVGALQSELLPLSASVAVMQTVDRIRQAAKGAR